VGYESLLHFFQINQDIARIDPRVFGGRIDPLAKKKDDFLFNQAGSASRHWGEKLTYSLGVSYLAGAFTVQDTNASRASLSPAVFAQPWPLRGFPSHPRCSNALQVPRSGQALGWGKGSELVLVSPPSSR